MKEQNEFLMNRLNAATAYHEGGHFRWKGEIPDGIELVAPFANMFISEKNMNKWIAKVEAVVLPTKQPPVTLESLVEPQKEPELTKRELLDYALDKFDIKLSPRLSRDDLANKVEELKNGLYDS